MPLRVLTAELVQSILQTMKVESLLQNEEGKTLEFKENADSLGKIIKTVIAFSNTSGGKLIIGVADKTCHTAKAV